MKKIGLILLGIVLVGAGCFGGGDKDGGGVAKVDGISTPGGRVLNVEVAKTLDEQASGLSGRTDIGDGMLFCFDESKEREFWMLGMESEIDVIWLNDGIVTGVTDRVSLLDDDGEVTRMPSYGSVNAVLEVGPGESTGMKIRDGVELLDVVELCK